MPTYDYRCVNGHAFEVFQKMSEEPVAACPECGESAERQISGGAGFLFKGDGFYITDYRSKEFKEKAKAESGGGGGEKTTDSSKDSPKAPKDGASGTSGEAKASSSKKDG